MSRLAQPCHHGTHSFTHVQSLKRLEDLDAGHRYFYASLVACALVYVQGVRYRENGVA